MSAESQGADTGALTAHRHPTRQAVLIAHTEALIHETGTERIDVAIRIAQHYHAQVPADQQALSLDTEPDGDDMKAYYKWAERIRVAVKRWMDGTVRIPVEIEDAWVAALPEPYRGRCIADLCARMGMMAIPIPDESSSTADLGQVMRQAGEEVTAAGAVFADGVIDLEDLPHLPDAERKCRASASASLALAARLRADYRRLTEEGDE